MVFACDYFTVDNNKLETNLFVSFMPLLAMSSW